MKKLTLTLLSAAAIWLCMAPASQAGPGHFGIFIGPPVFYPPAPYYYGPGYYGPSYGYYGPHYYWHHGYRGGYHRGR